LVLKDKHCMNEETILQVPRKHACRVIDLVSVGNPRCRNRDREGVDLFAGLNLLIYGPYVKYIPMSATSPVD